MRSGDRNMIVHVPELLVRWAWPLPAKATRAIEVSDKNKGYIIGGHSVTRNRVVLNDNTHASILHQHLACIMYGHQFALGKMFAAYSRSNSGYAAFCRIVEQIPQIWLSKIDADKRVGLSSSLLSFDLDTFRHDSLVPRHGGRVIQDPRYCKLFLDNELIAIDLGYLQGAPIGKKRFYFLLTQYALSSPSRENPPVMELTLPDILDHLTSGGPRSRTDLYKKTLRHIEGECLVNGHAYVVRTDSAKMTVSAMPKTGQLHHHFADKARAAGLTETEIKARFSNDTVQNFVIDELYRILGLEAELPNEEIAGMEKFLIRAYNAMVRSYTGESASRADAYMVRLSAIAKAAREKPAPERAKYINGSLSREVDAFFHKQREFNL